MIEQAHRGRRAREGDEVGRLQEGEARHEALEARRRGSSAGLRVDLLPAAAVGAEEQAGRGAGIGEQPDVDVDGGGDRRRRASGEVVGAAQDDAALAVGDVGVAAVASSRLAAPRTAPPRGRARRRRRRRRSQERVANEERRRDRRASWRVSRSDLSYCQAAVAATSRRAPSCRGCAATRAPRRSSTPRKQKTPMNTHHAQPRRHLDRQRHDRRAPSSPSDSAIGPPSRSRRPDHRRDDAAEAGEAPRPGRRRTPGAAGCAPSVRRRTAAPARSSR